MTWRVEFMLLIGQDPPQELIQDRELYEVYMRFLDKNV